MAVLGSVMLVIAFAIRLLSSEANGFAAGLQDTRDESLAECRSNAALSGSAMLQAKSPVKRPHWHYMRKKTPTPGRSLLLRSNQSALPPMSAAGSGITFVRTFVTSGICFFAECGCPPFRKSQCTEASRESATSWCGQSPSNCETCNAVWCDAEGDVTAMSSDTVDAPPPAIVQPPETPVLSTTSSGICFFAECGCPPFRNRFCTEASRENATSWCGQSQSNCATCNAVWCDAEGNLTAMSSETVDAPPPAVVQPPETPVLSTSSSGICYFAECGCPPFQNSNCTEASRENATSWCGQSSGNCETCNAVWCNAEIVPTAMSSETVDAPPPAIVQPPETPVQSTTSSGICYFAECGCPPFRNLVCTEASVEPATSWCGQSKSNCESCNAVWC